MIICDKELCTGCGLCSSTCPVHCITMEEDEYGFLYPVINPDKCINCGKCKKRCPVITDIESCYPLKSFAAWSLDLEDRRPPLRVVLLLYSLTSLSQAEVWFMAVHTKMEK